MQPATAADCQLKMLATVDTETDSFGGMLIPGNFGGVRKLLLVDTDGAFHELRESVVKELGLTTRESQQASVVDVLNQDTSTVARAPAFSIGTMVPTSVDFVVAKSDSLFGGSRVDGLFFPGVYYRSLDVDLDFPGHKFNLLSQDHCPGQVVYWPNNGVAVVPFQYDGLHIVVPVKVDGSEVMAEVDSGSSNTVMFTRTARRLGVDVDIPGAATDTGPLGDNPRIRTYSYRFHSLSIQGITVNNPTMTLLPDLRSRSYDGPSTSGGSNDTRLGRARGQSGREMVLGMSILRHLHVYIAAKEQKLYITAGGALATTAAPAAQ